MTLIDVLIWMATIVTALLVITFPRRRRIMVGSQPVVNKPLKVYMPPPPPPRSAAPHERSER